MGMKDQFQEKSRKMQDQAKEKAGQAKEKAGQAREKAGQRGPQGRDQQERTHQPQRDRAEGGMRDRDRAQGGMRDMEDRFDPDHTA
ncbi:hypothetical protein E5082_15440 [Streptomyces griseoluteus]|uniref:Uncharacterized protein n=1 Tax=Streptomyces griseoluteus TaxID=29306 RepID=A0A4Z1DJF8_STRGP|nr:hypothetical protein [Streptomyces griseoluteus]TGN82993.1 hypothetical protein E5082_15440 [Streptomyces griseoluteus]GHF17058.1 hypothetical protein GCM10017776_38470 [Streptomyces griseoluteus]